MADFYQELKDFSGGVIGSIDPDTQPVNSATEAWNTAFRFVGGGQASLGMRPGMSDVNTVATSIGPVNSFHPYSYQAGSAFSNLQMVVGRDGSLYSLAALGSELIPPANYPSPSGVAFGTLTRYAQSAVLGGRFFIISGAEKGDPDEGQKRSLVGTTYVPFGLEPIGTVSVTAAAGGSASMPEGEYDVAVTSYNSTSGGESSRTAISTVTLTAGQRIRVQITPSSSESAQYSHWRIYLRRNSTQAYLYQVQAIEDNGGSSVASDGNIPIASTDVYVDISAATIANHLIVSPDESENDLSVLYPKAIAVFGRRLFLADNTTIYWSKLDQGDNFPPENAETISVFKGDRIMTLLPFRDDILLILTATSLWGIFGSDPQSWTIQEIDAHVGTISPRSVVKFGDVATWWSKTDGPVIFDGTKIQRIGLELLGKELVIDDPDSSKVENVQAGHDPMGQRIVFGYCSSSINGISGENNRILVFNYRLNKWESSNWNPVDPLAFGLGYTTDGDPRLYIGSYNGLIFYFNDSREDDGLDFGEQDTGPFTMTGQLGGYLSRVSGTFDTDVGFAGRQMHVFSADGVYLGSDRIASNTGTDLVPTTSIPSDIGTTYLVYAGCPLVRIYTKWFDGDQAFLRKRFDRIYVDARCENATSASPGLQVFTSMDFSSTLSLLKSFSSSDWTVGKHSNKRISVGVSGVSLRIMIQWVADQNTDFSLSKLALLGRTLSDRYLYD